jgi:hypothetical protein
MLLTQSSETVAVGDAKYFPRLSAHANEPHNAKIVMEKNFSGKESL